MGWEYCTVCEYTYTSCFTPPPGDPFYMCPFSLVLRYSIIDRYLSQNWSPAKTASSYEAFDIVDVALSWDVFSFMVMGGLAGEEKMWLRLRGATLGSKELDSIGAELGMLTRWLVSTESWGEEAQSFREL